MPKKSSNESVSITFHGGAQEVTGACYELRHKDTVILIDCGLFQGQKAMNEENYKKFRFHPKEIKAVIITHSHIDHIGRLPKLVSEGFRGTVYSTLPTKELSRVLLEDEMHFFKNEEPLYTEKDVASIINKWKELSYRDYTSIGDVGIILHDAGHILGSAMIEIHAGPKRILFTGDLGNVPSVLLSPPEQIPRDTQYLFTESTYGNKVHQDVENRALLLERAIEDVVTKRGALMIPAFATERTQDILYELNSMVMNSRIPKIPIFVDSPLATRTTEIFGRYNDYYSDSVKTMIKNDPEIFNFKGLRFTENVEDSKKINDIPMPKVIIAGSGMSTGGRILHHERRYLRDKNSILLITGFQSAGSLGRKLLDGEKEVRIFHETIPVRAEIRNIPGFSAHADNPQLFSFIKKGKDALKKIWVIQGEKEPAAELAQEVKDRLGIPADVPSLYQTIVLE